ncbi:MAG: cytochrome c553 [Psychromonas sp.]|jgi:cytochrome c553
MTAQYLSNRQEMSALTNQDLADIAAFYTSMKEQK